MNEKVRFLAALFATLGACALVVRCHGAGGRDQPPDSTKPEIDAGSDASAMAPEGPSLWVVLDDARFADARAFEDDAHHAEAASALQVDLAKVLSAHERCEAQYVIGRLRALGSDDAGASAAFDAVSEGEGATACAPLVDYARARAAAAYERMGKPEDAIARATSSSRLPYGSG